MNSPRAAARPSLDATTMWPLLVRSTTVTRGSVSRHLAEQAADPGVVRAVVDEDQLPVGVRLVQHRADHRLQDVERRVVDRCDDGEEGSGGAHDRTGAAARARADEAAAAGSRRSARARSASSSASLPQPVEAALEVGVVRLVRVGALLLGDHGRLEPEDVVAPGQRAVPLVDALQHPVGVPVPAPGLVVGDDRLQRRAGGPGLARGEGAGGGDVLVVEGARLVAHPLDDRGRQQVLVEGDLGHVQRVQHRGPQDLDGEVRALEQVAHGLGGEEAEVGAVQQALVACSPSDPGAAPA